MRLPIRESSLHGSPYTWSHQRVHGIEIEAHVNVVSAIGNACQRFLHHTVYAVPIDIRHRVHLNAVFFQACLLARIQTSDTNQGNIFCPNLRKYAADIGQLPDSETQHGGERHTMDVSGGRGLWCVDVAMRIDPEKPQLLALPLTSRGKPGDSAHSNGVIATEHQRKVAALYDRLDLPGQMIGDPGNLGEITRPLVADLQLLHVLDDEVAVVHDLMAELSQAIVYARDANCRRPHVDAAATRAEVHRHPEHINDHRRDRTPGCQRAS